MKVNAFAIIDKGKNEIVRGRDLDGNEIAMVSPFRRELEASLGLAKSVALPSNTIDWHVLPITIEF